MASHLKLIRFHLEGSFVKKGRSLKYVNGKLLDHPFDPDYCSVPVLKAICEDAGYISNVKCIWYLIPGQSLSKGLRQLTGDDSSREMIKYMEESGVIDVYLEHVVDEPEVIHNLEYEGDNEDENVDEGLDEVVDEAADEDMNGDFAGVDVEAEVDDDRGIDMNEGDGGIDVETEAGDGNRVEPEVADGDDNRDGNVGDDHNRDGNVGDDHNRDGNANGIHTEAFDGYISSEYYPFDTGEFVSDAEDMIDDATRRPSKNKSYNPHASNPYLELGMIFADVEQFRNAVAKYAIFNNKPIEWHTNKPHKLSAYCAGPKCHWEIYASVD